MKLKNWKKVKIIVPNSQWNNHPAWLNTKTNVLLYIGQIGNVYGVFVLSADRKKKEFLNMWRGSNSKSGCLEIARKFMRKNPNYSKVTDDRKRGFRTKSNIIIKR